MSKYSRDNLTQMHENKLCICDGGLETGLIFDLGIDLPMFCALVALKTKAGEDALYKYYANYAKLAVKYKVNFCLETATWRASPEWGEKVLLELFVLRHPHFHDVSVLRLPSLSHRDSTLFHALSLQVWD